MFFHLVVKCQKLQHANGPLLALGPPPLRFARSDRRAGIPEINAVAKAVIADYGASDAAMLEIIFGKGKPEGKLPF